MDVLRGIFDGGCTCIQVPVLASSMVAILYMYEYAIHCTVISIDGPSSRGLRSDIFNRSMDDPGQFQKLPTHPSSHRTLTTSPLYKSNKV